MTPFSAEEFIGSLLVDASAQACVTCSFQAEDMVVLDMVRKLRPGVAVLFLDTGYHFAETYAYRDRMTRAWGLNLVNVQPDVPPEGDLYRTDPTQCCKIRKVEPLLRNLRGYDLWFTGLRREQSPTRANLQTMETQSLPGGGQIRKANPLAFWKANEVWAYLRVNEIEHLPLYDRGYASIGCEPCTTIPQDPSNPRSGRWNGVKLECGIHTFSQGD